MGIGMGGGGASLPVCRIFRRDIDVIFIHRWSGEAEFVQLYPLQLPRVDEHSSPCFLHLIISNKDA